MSDENTNAILPWAAPVAADGSKKEDSKADNTDGSTFSPSLSTEQRIEVRWQLTDEESGEETFRWWGAEIIQPPAAESLGNWQIRYDASDGYEEEKAEIRFVSARYLRHVEDPAMLLWRLEGAVTEEESDAGSEHGEDVIAIGEISAAYEDLEREMGQTMEQAALKELQTLDPHQQRYLVSGFKDYMDSITHQLKELVDAKEENYVVTESDIQQILAGLKRRRVS